MAYRATPLANRHSPAKLLMGRRIRTTVPVVPSSLNPGWPDISKLEKEHNSRQKQWKNFNKRHRAHDLPERELGDHVWVTDTKEKGTVRARADSPRSYIVETVEPTATPVDLPDITQHS